MNEEAGFIAALLAEPDDRTAMLAYADWLQERADPRAEYLRALTADPPNRRRLAQLWRKLDHQWIRIIDTRYYRVGIRVRITEGSFAHCEGDICTVTADRQMATLVITFWGRPLPVELPLEQLDIVSPES